MLLASLVVFQGPMVWGIERPPDEKKESRRKPSEMVDRFFKSHDANDDGVVDFAEFQSGRMKSLDEEIQRKIFGRFDKNKNGKLEREEMKEILKPRGEGIRDFFRKLDTNQDKKISFKEFQANERMKELEAEKVRKIFDRMDRNKDGVLDQKDHPPHHPGEGERGERPWPGDDGDGKITREEFGKAPWHKKLSKEEVDRRFAKMDRNGDGQIDKKEMRPPERNERDGREQSKKNRSDKKKPAKDAGKGDRSEKPGKPKPSGPPNE